MWRNCSPRSLTVEGVPFSHIRRPTDQNERIAFQASTTTSPWRDSTQDKGANVLIHVEEIARVVLRLDLLEPPVVGSVCGGDGIAGLIVAQVIHIAAGGDEGLHLPIRFPRPRDAPIGICRLHPFGEYDKVVTIRAVRESPVADLHPGCSAVEVLEKQLAYLDSRGRVSRAPCHGIGTSRGYHPRKTNRACHSYTWCS
jgi:hypothetical protein